MTYTTNLEDFINTIPELLKKMPEKAIYEKLDALLYLHVKSLPDVYKVIHDIETDVPIYHNEISIPLSNSSNIIKHFKIVFNEEQKEPIILICCKTPSVYIDEIVSLALGALIALEDGDKIEDVSEQDIIFNASRFTNVEALRNAVEYIKEK